MLKNPSHLVALDALMTVYPDALVVCTHRDPVTSMASACSLSAEATAGTSTTFVGETIGRTQLEMLSRSWRTFTSARAAYDPAQFVDVDYREFVADPVGTTRSIYDSFGLEWTPGRAGGRRGDRSRVPLRRQTPVPLVLAGRLRADRGRGARGVRVRRRRL